MLLSVFSIYKNNYRTDKRERNDNSHLQSLALIFTLLEKDI